MPKHQEARKSVSAHYDVAAERYHEQYEREHLYNHGLSYPANYFRLQLLLNSFAKKGIKRIIEVGVGEGTPLSTLAGMGMEAWGFDLSKKMIKKCKQRMKKYHLDPNRIFWGDIQEPITYAHVLKDGLFDGLMAMGVMPHVGNDDAVLDNMASLVRPGGMVFIEFRNKLFSLFTFNRYTYEFLIGDLLRDVDDKMKQLVSQELKSKLQMDQPQLRTTLGNSDAPGYDAILSRFHIPFEVVEMFEKRHFKKIKLLWYHYHPAMPHLEKKMPELFRKEAIRLERDPSGWRGMFLCSAFVVEAVKG